MSKRTQAVVLNIVLITVLGSGLIGDATGNRYLLGFFALASAVGLHMTVEASKREKNRKSERRVKP